MKKIICILSALILCACVSITPVENQLNMADVDFTSLLHKKVNTACTVFLFGIPVGTKSVAEAAWEAEISKIEYIEHRYDTLFLFITRKCQDIFGE